MSNNKVREPSYLEYKGKFKGLFGWIFSTDHKRIGLLYLYSIMTFFIVGAILGLLMKFELIASNLSKEEEDKLRAAFAEEETAPAY